ncbi:MAG: LacI family DNA-binding transcriptional regulator [Candidatus Nanopelagicales bacterium]
MTTLSSPSSPAQGPSGHRPRPTMREVAALAGVSLKTVSRVINREPGVSAALVIRVERAAAQLDFRPNLTAANLRRSGQRTATIGLVLEDVSNPFFASILRGVEEVAVQRGVAVFAASLDEDQNQEQQIVEAFSSRRVDGLILAPTALEQGYLANEMRSGLVMAFVDRAPRGVEGDVVVTDNRAATQNAVQQLIAHGHRRIAFVGGVSALPTAEDRYDGFLDAMMAAQVKVPANYVVRDIRTVEQAEISITGLLQGAQPPTALFTAQNLISMGAVRALRALGLEKEVAQIGFDDFELADVLNPGVSVVAQDPRRIGRLAAEALFARLADAARQATTTVVPSELITRGSGEIRPPLQH